MSAVPTVIDLFCGIGGLTHGALLAGLNVVAGIDIDPSCQFAFEFNNPSARFIGADVSTLPPEKIAELYPAKGPRVLIGCAPCQPFSKYTERYRKRKSASDLARDKYNKDDNKWRLLYSFANIVERIQPDVVSMENVPGLAKERVFVDFHDTLTRLGYKVSHSVVYCPDYGVPQNRRRLVLLASKFGDIEIIPPLFNTKNYPTVREVIGNLPPLKAGERRQDDALHAAARLSTTNLQRIKNSTPGGTWLDWDDNLRLRCHKKSAGKTYRSIYGRMKWDAPSPTITTQFYGYGNGRFGHPEQDRALSLREGALLQSFPKNYAFVNQNKPFKRREVGRHIGNAVPVELGKAIGVSLLNHISEAN
ncbi:MAG: DNA cytosine methyltransferase [Deltaproteobacteria bacterium]|nr:DNA cytosine methyltransferase [Deltaproteobacteria bacterium]